MLEAYRQHVAERAALGVPPKPLDDAQTAALVELLKNPPAGEEAFLVDLLENRVPAGVDQAAYVKAAFLAALAKGEATSPLVSKERAVYLLGTMLGGYNVAPLVALLDDAALAELAAEALKKTLLVFDAFHDVADKAKAGNANAQAVMQSWADAEWFTTRKDVPTEIKLTVFKVTGETNTDDLSPAQDAWSRPDIPLHANAMLKNVRDGINPEVPGEVGPLNQIKDLIAKGNQVAYVGDVVGTGSSRKSATNSVLWFFGDEIAHIPNKKDGGYCLGSKIAPIFFNTMEDAGALPIEIDVANMNMGDEIVLNIDHAAAKVTATKDGAVIAEAELKTPVLLDEVRAGGRINLIVGRGLTTKAREALGLAPSTLFRTPVQPAATGKGFTQAQKMVGRACGLPEGQGVLPGTYCEPKMTTVGSQDTTGPMTRDELKDLACLGFSADLVMQSFCHTAAYPKPVDVQMQHSLPDFIMNRGGVSLRPGDGIIHSWLNRMLLPDTVGTGGDSHTRFPIGISFPAGSGLVAFAAATGVMPLDMPESVLVKFKGKMQPGITLRDLVHAIPYVAIQQGDLTVEKKGKKNIFSGRILEIDLTEMETDLTVEQAFELSDASAERSAAGCSITLSEEKVAEYLKSNITMLKWMISEGYGDARTMARRVENMEKWLANPSLLKADADAEYTKVYEIDLATITEPVLCCPNDPDDAKLLSDVQGVKIDEVFVGSCMTNIGHFRATGKLLEKVPGGVLSTRLWIAPPTRMDERQLMEEGFYNTYGKAGARTEMPGCSLCMGNQARVAPNTTCVSTSTRNFPNRLGQGANVYLASAELASVAAVLGKLPTPEEYQQYAAQIDSMSADIYQYLSFDKMGDYTDAAANVDTKKIAAAQLT
ncbi:bifunctional aconitate hydratase 2/2-methylisocitrate dehydratase [Acinetobacter johnsonii]|uniref:Aconitate hydratase B n=1 Tax=Acinetobacter johnsonii TaxID=40214 RepID=A0A1R7QCF8_ACIJO|nr:bifunctional aconitate hydratase 2/2-methylisocitrate dehydratase [Acinetobacter johnsonii]MBJ7435666.1 bifunctional aconitate hydratase 2/2-methylisocitrate dehydratase [Acinetobacter sp.]NWK61234.1 bifunctional aconitate hydratase 2/2-methylisocitrate dehydratase [Acinetobacter sp. SwsAc3]ALV72536.1 bifunctional aconitate hydratase 2/2-methylisocitrate dehydratase [Acinetobacter johnsonii XBB1]MCF7642775.1 bifunctional aconitate hydratase 2/2-methylisocitrate dehydratase [Acinetobacter joh